MLPESQKNEFFLRASWQNMQTSRKCVPYGSSKDLWLVMREGTVADVDNALALLKKNGGNVNARNQFGLTPLHIATWRNHVPIVKRLLDAGADPNARVCFTFQYSKYNFNLCSDVCKLLL